MAPTFQPSIEDVERSDKGAGHPVDPTCQPSIEDVSVERLHKGSGHLVSPTCMTGKDGHKPGITTGEYIFTAEYTAVNTRGIYYTVVYTTV